MKPIIAFLRRMAHMTIRIDFGDDQYWSCTRKQKYGHEATALRCANQQPDKQLGCYKCRYCSGWHLYSLQSI